MRGALSLEKLPLTRASETEPLKVVFGSPSGETTGPSEVTVVFNKPMRKLGLSDAGRSSVVAGPALPEPPLSIAMSPRVPGSWDWVGTNALRFSAAAPLPDATAFRVDVAAGTKALDGSALAEPFTLLFSTPRPAVIVSSPPAGEDHVSPERRIDLSFNQPVTEAEVQRAVSIRAEGSSAPLPFSVGRPEKDNDPKQVELTPRVPLPRGVEIRVRIDPSFHAEAGPLTAGKAAEIAFRTIDPPRLLAIDCEKLEAAKGACSSRGPLTFRFNNWVSSAGLASAITFEPPVKLDLSRWPWDSDGAANEIELHGDFKPGETYRVRVHTGVTGPKVFDEYEQRLVVDERRMIRFGDLLPEVEFAGSGVYWPKSGPHELQVLATNVTDMAVSASSRTQTQVLSALASGKVEGSRGQPQLSVPNPPHNRTTTSILRLSDLLPARDPHGPILLQATYRRGDEARTITRELQLTDLGISARIAREELVLWVTRLSNGTPVDRAEVTVHRLPAGAAPSPSPAPSSIAAVTGATGEATLPLAGLLQGSAKDERVAVFVRSGDDVAYQLLNVPAAPGAVGSIFTERGLYRPGESVSIKSIFRIPAAAGLTTPALRTVSFRVFSAADEPFAAWTAPLSAFGTTDHTLHLPESAPVGPYWLEAELQGASVRGHFEVAEYRPTELAVEVNADRAAYVRGDTLTCTVQGRYLHGGAMNGSAASIDLPRRDASFVPPGLDGFVVGERSLRFRGGHAGSGGGILDRQGRYRFTTTLDLSDQEGPETVSCNTEVTDLNRQSLTASTTALVHPGEFYLGLESPADHVVRPGAVLTPGVLAVDPQGGRRKVAVRLQLWRREIHTESNGEEREVDSPLHACDVTTSLTKAACPLQVPALPYGERDTLIVRATAQDKRGNPLSSSYRLWPSNRARPQLPLAKPGSRPKSLEINLARQEYEIGQTATLRIRSPFSPPATAWVTVERESVLWTQKVTFDPPPSGAPSDASSRDQSSTSQGSEAQVLIPITRALIPNAQVSVTLIHGTDIERASTWLEVDPAPRRLDVAIRASTTQAAPGDSIDLDVAVTGAEGAPARAEVTLFAADEGTLSLIRYRTPDPLSDVFRTRPIKVDAADSREDLFLPGHYRHRAKPPVVRMGATMVSRPRVDFRQTALFEPRLLTDASGHVRHRVKLPDGLTTYRFMAVAAAEDDRFGSAEAHVTTSKPLMVHATLPRVIRAGDQFDASVVLTTRDLPSVDVELDASLSGLSPMGPLRRTVHLEAGAPTEVRLPIRADRVGSTRVTVHASARSRSSAVIAQDTLALSGEVTAPILPEAAALSGETRAAVAEALGDLSTVRQDVGGLELHLARTPLAGLAPGIRQLIEYPYGCTEQTVSRMLPLLSLRSLAELLGEPLPKDIGGALQAAAQKVASHQRADGGFGLWPESPESEPWVTAYAVFGLREARERGVPMKSATLERAIGYLQRTLDDLGPSEGHGSSPRHLLRDSDLAAAAFTLDVLAESGAKDAAKMGYLFQERSRLPLFSKALLLHALAISGSDEGSIQALRREVEASLRVDGPAARAISSGPGAYAALLDSETRTSALVLRALLALDPAHPLASRLALGLLAARHGGVFRSTQEAAWALLALDAFRKAQPSAPADFDARVFLGSSLLTEASFHGAGSPPSVALTLPIAEVIKGSGQPLTFAVTGAGELHYEARLRFARKVLPTELEDAGFFVQKTMRAVSRGANAGPSQAETAGAFAAGDVVLCEVSVITPSPRHYVVVDDPLPGGFEAVDIDLRKGGEDQRWLERNPASRREIRDGRVVYFIDHLPAGFSRYRFLARATMPGTFILPPTRVEEMYVPETSGRTAATVIRIR